MGQLFSNNASALLQEDLLAGATQITLAPGEGDRFPLPAVGDPTSFAVLTLEDIQGNIEICNMPERSGDILTIERAQEDTGAAGFATGSRVECRLTAGSLQSFQQVGDVDFQGQGQLDTDGFKVWHDTDPGAYSFFESKYYTTEAGEQVYETFSPDVPGVIWAVSIIGVDGAKRNIALGFSSDKETEGSMSFRVPGNLEFEHRTRFSEHISMFAAWDTNADNNNEMSWLPQQFAGSAEYSWMCRSDGDFKVGFNTLGQFYCRSEVSIQAPNQSLTPGKSVVSRLQANPFGINGEVMWSYPAIDGKRPASQSATEDKRELAYWFTTRVQNNEDPENPKWDNRTSAINERGYFESFGDTPLLPNEAAPKAYVDRVVSEAVTGDAVAVITAAVYSRTELFSGTANGGNFSISPLKWTDFAELEIVTSVPAGPTLGPYYETMQISAQTLLDRGAGVGWTLAQGQDIDGGTLLFYVDASTFDVVQRGGFVGGTVVGVYGKFRVVDAAP